MGKDRRKLTPEVITEGEDKVPVNNNLQTMCDSGQYRTTILILFGGVCLTLADIKLKTVLTSELSVMSHTHLLQFVNLIVINCGTNPCFIEVDS